MRRRVVAAFDGGTVSSDAGVLLLGGPDEAIGFTTKEIGPGTGLGLSLVHAIVTDSGGAIDVKSASKRGSTFTI